MGTRVGGGFLLVNDRKTKEGQADYTGRVEFHGTDYSCAAWVKKGNDGRTMLSVKVTTIDPIVVPEIQPTPLKDG